ncbi:MSH4 [Bugula neritina]|uniref:MSH4 n=1 Tax=Bugula neritina TaxID=10212 RepID=A0A7J7KU72_BUGNE|nr:MSH4 [Bugula neritina]
MIITGANNSGKSFYLRTIAVIQVMAQIGCFVPAAFAMIRICDQLFSRIGSDHSLSHMESSFTVEMKEISFVLKHKTPTALVILDELCRGTSAVEAVDICFSICQQFLKMSAFTLFATHFKELCQLETAHSNCTNYCFVTQYESPKSGSFAQKIINDHKLKRGVARASRYGLKLAATMNFPEKVIKNAFAIADRLDRVHTERFVFAAIYRIFYKLLDQKKKPVNYMTQLVDPRKQLFDRTSLKEKNLHNSNSNL